MYATLCMGACTRHSPVAPLAARIPSSHAGERGPRTNAECGNSPGTVEFPAQIASNAENVSIW